MFEGCEATFVKKYPEHLPKVMHGKSTLEMLVALNWGVGTPWSDPRKRSKYDTSHRKVFQLECHVKDKVRIMKVFLDIKQRGMEHKYLGRRPISSSS